MRILLIISILFFSVSCHNGNNERLMDLGEMSDGFQEVLEIPVTEQPPPPAEGSRTEEITQKVIKTGGIDFQSENIQEDYREIRELLPSFQAYIENENQSKSSERISYNLTIRVPSDVYDTLYVSLSDLASRIDHKYSNMEDVTERYYDLKARIKNKTTLEQRYLELLEKATAIKDILEIEKNLNEVRTEIERLQGQFNYLSKQVGFSTINLSFYEDLPYIYDSTQRKGFGARILSALDNGWQGFLSFLVGLTTLWPFFILIIGVIYLFRKFRGKWIRKN